MTDTTLPGEPSPVEKLLAEFLLRLDEDPDISFDAFVAEHPEHEQALRNHWKIWHSLAAALSVGRQRQGEAPIEALPSAEEVYGDVIADLEAPRGRPDRYRVGRELGKGGFGVVLEVQDTELRRPLALKRLKVQHVEPGMPVPDVNADQLGRFLEEAQVTGQLAHPHIVPVHELGVDHLGRVYFTMRRIEGDDLGTVLKRSRLGDGLSTTRILGELVKACQAVAYAHSRKVLHRDLKPANIMLGDFGQLYVMDWGLAKLPTDEGGRTPVHTDRHDAGQELDSPIYTQAGAVVGTPSYMSLEQAQGGQQLGPAADVYALGAILYEVLAGFAPYADSDGWRGLSSTEKVEAVRAAPPTPVASAAPGSPPELVSVCERAMAREPVDRYATVDELREDISAYLEDRVVKAHATGTVVELKKWMSRNRGTAGAAAAALFALVIGLVASLHFLDESLASNSALELSNSDLEQSKAQIHQEYLESIVRAARLAMQRGGWVEAQQHLAEATRKGYPDGVKLRFMEAETWMARLDRDRAIEMLESLVEEEELEDLAGAVYLRLGALRQYDWGDGGEAMAWLGPAQRMPLSDADRSFLKGILSTRVADAIDSMKEALAEDPFHYLAGTTLVSLLFLSGQYDELDRWAGAFGVLYPDDPSPRLAVQLARALEGREVSSLSARDRERLGSVAARQLEAVLDLVVWCREEARKISNTAEAPPSVPKMVGWLAGALTRWASIKALAQHGDQGAGDLARSLSPNLPCLRASWGNGIDAFLSLFTGQYEQSLEQLDRAIESHPDGVFFTLRGIVRPLVLHDPAGDRVEIQRQVMKDCSADFRSAMESPSATGLLTRVNPGFRIQTLLPFLVAGDEAARVEAREVLFEVLNWPDLSSAEFEKFHHLARAARSYDIAAAFLSRWLAEEPKDPVALRRAARRAVEQKDFVGATAYCRRLLEVDPQDAEAADWLGDVRAQAESWLAGGDAPPTTAPGD